MQKITSAVIGTLTQDDRIEDWWHADHFIPVPFFGNEEMGITFMNYEPGEDETFMQEADAALTNFLQLTIDDRLAISHLVFANFENFKYAVGEDDISDELKALKDEQDIWNFVQANGLSVQRREYNDRDIYISVNCNCDWEEEHGLQLVFRQGKKITRVSAIDGHLTEADAYDKPDEEDPLLSAF